MKYLIAVILMAVFSYGQGNVSVLLQLKEPKEVKQKPDFLLMQEKVGSSRSGHLSGFK